MTRSWAEPWKIKMVEPLTMTTREHREHAIVDAGYKHVSDRIGELSALEHESL